MPVKRRLAKGCQHRITPEAIEAYEAGDALTLNRVLGIPPWEASPLDVTDAEPWPYPELYAASYRRAQELRRLLMAAATNNL
jgi:hypothetical protein